MSRPGGGPHPGPVGTPRARGQRGKRVHVTCSRCCCSTRNSSTIVQRAWAAIMENRPPHNLARHSSLMHSKLPSKSSPAKRDATRILTPQYNHAVASTDAFNTGLLTPQASQNTFDSDAATSLISPPPEDGARAGISNRQSVRVALPVFVLTNRPISEPALMDQSWFGTCFEFATRCRHGQFI
jgi:hypothetical protein